MNTIDAFRPINTNQTRDNTPDMAEKVAFLSRPQSYPTTPQHVKVVETHMSWVFLSDRHAYKLKKPVRYDYLDFSTLIASLTHLRPADC